MEEDLGRQRLEMGVARFGDDEGTMQVAKSTN